MSELNEAVMAAGRGEIWEDEGWFCREFVFTANFPGFAGHFPGNPVLPAVVQLMAGAGLAKRWLGRGVNVRAVHNAKFLAPIPPDAAVVVYAKAQGQESAAVRIVLENRTAATFTLKFSTDA